MQPDNFPARFHQGEIAMHRSIGKEAAIADIGKRFIRSYMPEQHRAFYQQLPYMVFGSVDANGWPWASILSGEPGFIQSPKSTSLLINRKPALIDPLNESINITGKPLGMLGIELHTRRRNRVNGRVRTSNLNSFSVKVDLSFGNCPKYINEKQLQPTKDITAVNQQFKHHTLTHLTGIARQLIQQADTFFVASTATKHQQPTKTPEVEGVDVSHRGGEAGFVNVSGNTLTIPDYTGNNIFNTLGNFLMNPKAGLIFPDFTTGNVLMLTGKVDIIPAEHAIVKSLPNALRAWQFEVTKGIFIEGYLPFSV